MLQSGKNQHQLGMEEGLIRPSLPAGVHLFYCMLTLLLLVKEIREAN